MKRKGFTLVELLAVIVVLAIIAVIIVPIISNMIDSARKQAFTESVNGIIDSTNNYVNEYVLLHNNDIVYPITFSCDGISCKNSSNETLQFKGSVPKSGNIVLTSDGVLAEYITDGKYCTYGYKWNLVVEDSCGDVDVTKPTIEGVQNGKVITLTMIDNASGIDSYCATTDLSNCSWITPTNPSSEEHIVSNAGTWYFIAKDKKGNISNSINFDVPQTAFCTLTIPNDVSMWLNC